MFKTHWKILDFKGNSADIFHLFKDEPNAFFLDSSLSQDQSSRYSFIGFDPFDVFSGHDKNALKQLRRKFNRYSNQQNNEYSPLSSGLAGFLSYDFGLTIENIKTRNKEGVSVPGCYFGFYDTIITIDHFAQKIYISSTGLPEEKEYLRKAKAESRIREILKKLTSYRESPIDPFVSQEKSPINLAMRSNFTKNEYLDAVKKALEYIKHGDIYQVNLSQRFCFDVPKSVDPLELYRTLRDVSASGFGGYFAGNDFQILSGSPERFLRLQKGVVQTRPMKGTRPRGKNREDDVIQRQELIKSKKDIAELLMITDLERNDLGRACKFGSVKVKMMRAIEEYSTVFQCTSTIEGMLKKDKDLFDLITACFPGGSITGCPKIRAMEIIEELESVRRSIYTGALGYISFSGDMDFNVLIRTILNVKDKIYFHVGGGIVSDSTPEGEYNETLVKARAIFRSIQHVFYPQNKRTKTDNLALLTQES